MTEFIDRRTFLHAAAAGLATASTATPASGDRATRPAGTRPASAPAYGRRRIRKAVHLSMLPETLPLTDRLRLAVECGFDGLECSTLFDEALVTALRRAADRAGIRIHSILDGSYPDSPLTSEQAETARRGLAIVRQSMRNARALGADTVLLIPAKVTPEVSYRQAYERSQRAIRELLPLARELGVTLAVENVGNRFLLSPLEFARYTDEINDPFLRAYFDIGNSLVLWSYPHDWIRTLGQRIHRVHVKDWDSKKRRFVLPGDGEVDWAAVREALAAVDYEGFATAELPGGDAEYLKDLSSRMSAVLAA